MMKKNTTNMRMTTMLKDLRNISSNMLSTSLTTQTQTKNQDQNNINIDLKNIQTKLDDNMTLITRYKEYIVRLDVNDKSKRDINAIRMSSTIRTNLKEIEKSINIETEKQKLNSQKLNSDNDKRVVLFAKILQYQIGEFSSNLKNYYDDGIMTKRKQRKANKLNSNNNKIDDDSDSDSDSILSRPNLASTFKTDEENQFIQEHAKARENQDQLLDEIHRGVVELQQLANDIKVSIDVSSKIIKEELEPKLDNTIQHFKTTNKQLSEILESTGGVSRWCPFLICFIILICLIGYVISLAK